jgi:hypothetical protein
MNQLELTNEQYKQKYLKYKKKYLDLQVELEGKGSIERETGARNLIRDFKESCKDYKDKDSCNNGSSKSKLMRNKYNCMWTINDECRKENKKRKNKILAKYEAKYEMFQDALNKKFILKHNNKKYYRNEVRGSKDRKTTYFIYENCNIKKKNSDKCNKSEKIIILFKDVASNESQYGYKYKEFYYYSQEAWDENEDENQNKYSIVLNNDYEQYSDNPSSQLRKYLVEGEKFTKTKIDLNNISFSKKDGKERFSII